MQRGLGMQWNADSANQYMSPYQSQVMDQWANRFGDMRANTLNDVNQEAMQSGAFGGSRHGVMGGVALSELGKQQSLQNAQMLQQGYGDAYNQFVLRIAVQAFAGQCAGGIAARAGAVVVVHHQAGLTVRCLLSTRPKDKERLDVLFRQRGFVNVCNTSTIHEGGGL